MHYVCTEWHTEATESRIYDKHAVYVPQKLKLTSYCGGGCIGDGEGGACSNVSMI